MQYPLSVSQVPFGDRGGNLVRFDTGLLKLQAEYDYLLGRQAILSSAMPGPAFFHYQQCIEKFFKAYQAFLGRRVVKSHSLTYWLNELKGQGSFFDDPDLAVACEVLSPFAETGRYPNDRLQQHGWEVPSVLNFLDEFVYEMRKLFQPRAQGENIADGIQTLQLHAVYGSGHAQFVNAQIMQSFAVDNPFKAAIEAQITNTNS